MEKIRLFASLEKIVSHLPELEQQMGDITFDVTEKARLLLAEHRRTGEHRVTQTKARVDHFVNLEGPAAVSVEVGHHHKQSGEFTEGIHVLRDAVLGASTPEVNEGGP